MESPKNKVKGETEELLRQIKIENRIQMFCYYHTLAWQMFAATIATVIVLATLPFLVNINPSRQFTYFVFDEVCTVLILGGGLYLVHRLRGYGARWISFPTEDDSVSPRAWIDYVETGEWRTRRSDRARTFDYFLISVFLAGAVYVLFSACFR
jgi:hypothetical protein